MLLLNVAVATAGAVEREVARATEYYESYGQADSLWAVGDIRDAVRIYTDLIREYPDDPGTWYRLARGSEALDDSDTAIRAYKRAIRIGFDSPDWLSYRVARLYGASGQPDSALAWLKRAREARYGDLPEIATADEFEPLHQDPEFRRMAGMLPERGMSRNEGWRFDLDFLMAELQRLHLSFDCPSPSPALDSAAADLRRRIPGLSNDQLLVEFERLITMAGDGHTAIYGPGEDSPLEFESGSLPVLFYLFDDGLFIVDAAGGYRQWIGSEVLAFGSRPTSEILAALDTYVHHDNAETHKWLGVHFALQRSIVLYQYLGATSQPNRLALTVRDRDGNEHEVALRGGDFSFRRKLRPQPDAPRVPLWLQHVDTNYWIRALPEVDALYWQFNSVRDMDGGPTLHDYADTLRSRLEATGAHHLIVDVRHNNGGNTNLLRPLLRLLTWWEQDASDHEIFVVMGRNTFSAAQNFISRVEQWTDAVFVGEPSSSSPNFIGEETALVLPYSRVRGSISNRYWQNSDPTDDRPWIAPQVPVNLSSSAYFSGRDPALETIVKIIEHTEQAATP
jgi:tetratricopeptide (TPR) repeat protein